MWETHCTYVQRHLQGKNRQKTRATSIYFAFLSSHASWRSHDPGQMVLSTHTKFIFHAFSGVSSLNISLPRVHCRWTTWCSRELYTLCLSTHFPYIPSVIFVRFRGRRNLPLSAFRLFIFFPPRCKSLIQALETQHLFMKNHLKH